MQLPILWITSECSETAIRATNAALFDLTRSHGTPCGNTAAFNWMLTYSTNPWNPPRTEESSGDDEWNDEEWLSRSTSELRAWMEENPF